MQQGRSNDVMITSSDQDYETRFYIGYYSDTIYSKLLSSSFVSGGFVAFFETLSSPNFHKPNINGEENIKITTSRFHDIFVPQ